MSRVWWYRRGRSVLCIRITPIVVCRLVCWSDMRLGGETLSNRRESLWCRRAILRAVWVVCRRIRLHRISTIVHSLLIVVTIVWLRCSASTSTVHTTTTTSSKPTPSATPTAIIMRILSKMWARLRKLLLRRGRRRWWRRRKWETLLRCHHKIGIVVVSQSVWQFHVDSESR